MIVIYVGAVIDNGQLISGSVSKNSVVWNLLRSVFIDRERVYVLIKSVVNRAECDAGRRVFI